MVKKSSFLFLVGAFILTGVMVGCHKPANPVIPANSAVLNLVIPSKILNALSTAKSMKTISKAAVPDVSMGAFEYYLTTDGEAPVTGTIVYNSGSYVGNIFINLPKAGNWLVSGEWFDLSILNGGVKKPTSKLAVPGFISAPEFVGADMVNVQGTTSFTLNMEDIGVGGGEYTCYQSNLTDPTSCDYVTLGGAWYDLYSFNSGLFQDSTTGGTGDMEAMYDPVTTNSTYLSATNTPYFGAGPPPPPPPLPSIFTYLGNGDLVNFPVVPSNAKFYPDTIAAKAAVVGSAAASITVNDIFAVKVPSTNALVWLQVWIDNNACGGPTNSTFMQFWFVYQDEGLNYMKFDQTANGAANCNQNTIVGTTGG